MKPDTVPGKSLLWVDLLVWALSAFNAYGQEL